MEIKVENLEEIKEWLKELPKRDEKKLLAEVTTRIWKSSRKKAKKHFKTGTMERNLTYLVKKDKGYVFFENDGMLVNWNGKKVNYVAFVLFGSRPHTIKPKNKRALRWAKDENVYPPEVHNPRSLFAFAKQVHHPGYRGDDFLIKSAKDIFSKLEKIYKEI